MPNNSEINGDTITTGNVVNNQWLNTLATMTDS